MRRRALAVTKIVFSAVLSAYLTLGHAAPNTGPTRAAPYAPGLGDFMTAYVQPHHIKLWFAGVSGNWKLAAYEANELDETFDDIVSYQSNWHDLPIGSFVETLIRPQLKRVAAAIAAKETTRFKSAYADLNVACNRCHASAQHGFVNIVTPDSNPYLDQDLNAVGNHVDSPDHPVELEQEPHHHVVFQNQLVRIFEVRISPGSSTFWHRHRYDNLAVWLSDSRTATERDGRLTYKEGLPGHLNFSSAGDNGYVHRVSDAGDAPYWVLDIELVQRPGGQLTATTTSGLEASLDNERVRVYTVSLKPGESGAPLTLGPGIVVVSPAVAVEQIGRDGAIERIAKDSPRWRWREPGTYVLRNNSSTVATAVEVEIK